jgi:hypothetical protein
VTARVKPCAICGKEFEFKLDRARYCSRTCAHKAWRTANPEGMPEINRRAWKNMTPERRDEVRQYMRQYREDNRERIRETKREQGRRYRQQVLDWYGGKCACCGESHPEFLAMDHVDGGGSEHRREIKTRLTTWLWRQGGPVPGFRILCHNCNQARGAYGYCPHEEER